MNYKKLISKRISGLSNSSSNQGAPVIALLAGLAAGAALAILFAPDSGKNTRERISDKALDLADNAKDNFLSIKDKIANGSDSLVALKDRIVDQVKSKIDHTTQEYKDFRESELSKGKSSVIISDDHHV
ncbi:YtxH domain-containing protein [Pedobacter metabolipauper]|uniref:Gas vesicle protein n=1 Tax=Pedobacter metabolipauper TaxID=425513 RepID=A0A4R6T1Z6_9SPHI|nr:YtxH domain-containing protein [Pedobacter metabolipauper]TDQ11341.1 gas vesicle protein [Pedobacter metabolipauper]